MLVLLPPSETKAVGGDGPPLDLDALTAPELNPTRELLVTALEKLATDVPASLAALGLSERQVGEVERNAELRVSPTAPALRRYTGVLYEALGAHAFTRAQRARADRRLAVASALFGIVRAGDPIPAYRLSGGTVLPGLGGLRPIWRAGLSATLSTVDDLVLDLRSGPYAGLAEVPHAVTVRVVTEDGAGRRLTVSHFNKAHKGRLAAALATGPREPSGLRGVLTIAAAAGITLERTGPRSLDLIAS